ncbi:hypothetical protein [Zooshikella ganghwensis]|uniref:hypothetical protein n=1 Tax=Zooshikella ganghwensis TaxID=202772 RepID=UPI00041A35B1|nr:hypothetical protein [Zooshikella ganghwensis]
MNNIIQNGDLSIWGVDEFAEAEKNKPLNQVKRIHIGAKCFRAVGIARLLKTICIYKEVELIRLADDYIKDSDMQTIEKEFRGIFPKAQFNWTHDLLPDGKHGR